MTKFDWEEIKAWFAEYQGKINDERKELIHKINMECYSKVIAILEEIIGPEKYHKIIEKHGKDYHPWKVLHDKEHHAQFDELLKAAFGATEYPLDKSKTLLQIADDLTAYEVHERFVE